MTVLDNVKDWNTFVLEHAPKSGAFLQSWEWGEFQRAVGREVRRYSTETSAAQIISYPIRGRFFGWDLHRGPIGNSDVLRQIQDDIKKTRGIFLHIEPGYRFEVLGSRLAKNRQPQHTLIVDLSRSEDELLAAMHEKTRYNIRLAERHGVVVESSTPDNQGKLFDEFYNLLRTTAARDRFHLHSATYYRKMMETLPNVSIFTARHKDEPLASALVIFFAGTATYLHGASGDRHRNLMAPHLLHWEIMRAAKADGNNSYDFWGIAPPDEPNHPWAGMTRFKMGFCGEVATMPEALELPLHHFWYSIYRLAQRALP